MIFGIILFERPYFKKRDFLVTVKVVFRQNPFDVKANLCQRQCFQFLANNFPGYFFKQVSVLVVFTITDSILKKWSCKWEK